jgi:hypothetical protein
LFLLVFGLIVIKAALIPVQNSTSFHQPWRSTKARSWFYVGTGALAAFFAGIIFQVAVTD